MSTESEPSNILNLAPLVTRFSLLPISLPQKHDKDPSSNVKPSSLSTPHPGTSSTTTASNTARTHQSSSGFFTPITSMFSQTNNPDSKSTTKDKWF
jgi:hypothetical protein